MTNTQGIPSDIFLNVLIYRCEGEDGWTALVLEMDIRGYGDTPAEAFQELGDLVRMQVSFAMFKEDPSLIWKPADPVWFERFADARRNQLRHQLLDIPPTKEPEYRASGMPTPPPHVIAELGRQFQVANA